MYYFIINPSSRSGEGRTIWRKVRNILDGRNLSYEFYFTRTSGHGTRLARQLAPRLSGHCLVIIGGDGTVNEVLNGLDAARDVTVGYIPTGSGNDFARGLGISSNPGEALAAILHPSCIRQIDLGYVRTPRKTAAFGISSGLGYDAEICYQVSHSPLKKVLNRLHLGNLIYALTALKLLLTYAPCSMDITVDGQRHTFRKVYFLAAMNLPYEGGGFRFCPNADPEDGILDCLVVHDMHPLKILLLFPTAYLGKHARFSGVTLLRGKRIHVRSREPEKIHRDGEFSGISDDVVFQTGEGRIRLVIR